MNQLILTICFAAFLLGACVGGSGSGVQHLDGGDFGGGQAQPGIQEVGNVEGPTPVEECAPNDFDCKSQKKGLTTPPGNPPPPPDDDGGPGSFTL